MAPAKVHSETGYQKFENRARVRFMHVAAPALRASHQRRGPAMVDFIAFVRAAVLFRFGRFGVRFIGRRPGDRFARRHRADGPLSRLTVHKVSRGRRAYRLFDWLGGGGPLGLQMPRQHVQKAHFRNYHLHARRRARRCGEALGGEPRGGRAKATRTGARCALRRRRRQTAPWRCHAGEHLVQDRAEGRHIGVGIALPYQALRRKQR